MPRLWRQIIKGEEGQALPIVLILLVVGGLTIAPTLNHVSTSLNAGRMVEENVKGIYAAEAGVEYALWQIVNSIEPDEGWQPLPVPENENVNQMDVVVSTAPMGTYALYSGDLQALSTQQTQDDHYNWLSVAGKMVWDEPAQAYKYTITVTWQAEPGSPAIKLEEVGARLPVGYSYQLGSAESFPDNLSDDDEDLVITLDWTGAHLLNWTLGTPRPEVSEGTRTQTQIFYVTGEGEREGDYTWAEATPESIGQVGEVIGTLYSITATATRPEDDEVDEVIARVRADVLWYEETAEISIILWQINPEE